MSLPAVLEGIGVAVTIWDLLTDDDELVQYLPDDQREYWNQLSEQRKAEILSAEWVAADYINSLARIKTRLARELRDDPSWRKQFRDRAYSGFYQGLSPTLESILTAVEEDKANVHNFGLDQYDIDTLKGTDRHEDIIKATADFNSPFMDPDFSDAFDRTAEAIQEIFADSREQHEFEHHVKDTGRNSPVN
jgi:hypothetical protein